MHTSRTMMLLEMTGVPVAEPGGGLPAGYRVAITEEIVRVKHTTASRLDVQELHWSFHARGGLVWIDQLRAADGRNRQSDAMSRRCWIGRLATLGIVRLLKSARIARAVS